MCVLIGRDRADCKKNALKNLWRFLLFEAKACQEERIESLVGISFRRASPLREISLSKLCLRGQYKSRTKLPHGRIDCKNSKCQSHLNSEFQSNQTIQTEKCARIKPVKEMPSHKRINMHNRMRIGCTPTVNVRTMSTSTKCVPFDRKSKTVAIEMFSHCYEFSFCVRCLAKSTNLVSRCAGGSVCVSVCRIRRALDTPIVERFPIRNGDAR